MSSRPSISGACERIRPSSRYSCSSRRALDDRLEVRPRSARSFLRAMGAGARAGTPRRRSFSSAGIGSPSGSEPEPGSGEYVKAPMLSSSARRGRTRRARGTPRRPPRGIPTMNVVRTAISGTLARIRASIAQVGRRVPAPAHRRQDRPGDVLERNVDVRDEAGLARHQVEHRVVESPGVRVEEADPGESRLRRERFDETGQAAAAHPEVLAVTRRVLGDEHQLRDALRFERRGLGDQRIDRSAALHSPHLGNRAERAGVVAPLAHFEIRIPRRRESTRGARSS